MLFFATRFRRLFAARLDLLWSRIGSEMGVPVFFEASVIDLNGEKRLTKMNIVAAWATMDQHYHINPRFPMRRLKAHSSVIPSCPMEGASSLIILRVRHSLSTI